MRNELVLRCAREAVARQREAIAAACRDEGGNLKSKKAARIEKMELALAARYRAGELDHTQPIFNAENAIHLFIDATSA